MTRINSSPADTFDGLDLSDLDLLDVEIVQTAHSAGIPEMGASCCPSLAGLCSSCCVDPT